MKLTSNYKTSLLSLFTITILVLLNGCGGGGSGGGSASSSGNGESGAAGINGRLVMSDGWDAPHVVPIYSLDLVSGKAQNLDILGKGHGSNIGADGSIIFVQNCSPTYNKQLVMMGANGLVTPISSCSNLLDNYPDATIGHYQYMSPKFSPDQKKIAVSLITTNEFVKTIYPMVAVFDRKKVDINTDLTKQPYTKLFIGYNSFAWKPDGSLLLIGSGQRLILKEGRYGEVLEELPTIKHGIYTTDKNLKNPTRIENKINTPIFSPDVNNKGTQVTYSTYNNIFIMNLSTGIPQKLRANTVASIAHSPVWSPDGRYIAYLQKESGYSPDDDMLHFYELSSKKIISIKGPRPYKTIEGPLSWIPIP